jgi:hypothetical protein
MNRSDIPNRFDTKREMEMKKLGIAGAYLALIALICLTAAAMGYASGMFDPDAIAPMAPRVAHVVSFVETAEGR